jgi:hypothetical protein
MDVQGDFFAMADGATAETVLDVLADQRD